MDFTVDSLKPCFIQLVSGTENKKSDDNPIDMVFATIEELQKFAADVCSDQFFTESNFGWCKHEPCPAYVRCKKEEDGCYKLYGSLNHNMDLHKTGNADLEGSLDDERNTNPEFYEDTTFLR